MQAAPYKNPGDVLQGRYEIVEFLGKGSFAEVYKGLDQRLGRDVAIKLMRLSLLDAAGFSDESQRLELMYRFHREAQVVAKLRAQNTVTLFDFGEDQQGDLFMVLEHVDGHTLRDEVVKNGPMSPDRVVTVLRQSLQSLHEAHAHDLLHRDIKPENIMIFDYLDAIDQVRVVDFGIAKALQEKASRNTAAGILVGTPRYVPPERILDNRLYPASDIYSLGSVAYFLLTGEEIYKDVQGTMAILREQTLPGSVVLPEVAWIPNQLAEIVNTMLAKPLGARYPSALDVLIALETYSFAQRVSEHNITDDIPVLDPGLIEPIGISGSFRALPRALVEQARQNLDADEAPTHVHAPHLPVVDVEPLTPGNPAALDLSGFGATGVPRLEVPSPQVMINPPTPTPVPAMDFGAEPVLAAEPIAELDDEEEDDYAQTQVVDVDPNMFE